MHTKNKKLWFTLVCIAGVCLFLFLWCFLKFQSTYSPVSDEVACDIDMVVYPFEISDDTGLHISSFGIMNGTKVDLERNVGIGYSSIINLDVLEKMFTHFHVSSEKQLYDKLGQYFAYRNFGKAEVCVFFDWYKEPYTLNIVIVESGDIRHISEEFITSDVIPIAITLEQETIYILLRNGTTFYIRTIHCSDYAVTSYDFDVSIYSEFYLYYIEFFAIDNNIVVFMNEYIKSDQAAKHNLSPGYSGAVAFIYNLEEKQLSYKNLSDSKIDFVCRDELRCIWGGCSAGEIEIILSDLEFAEQDRFLISLDQDTYTILPNSALIDNEMIYFHLTCPNESLTHSRGMFATYDMKNRKMDEILTYDYEGSVFIKYYRRDSELNVDNVYASSN